MADVIRLSLSLKPEARGVEAAAEVQRRAGELGLEVSAVGRATLSVRVSAETFERLFGSIPRRLPPLSPGEGDFGRPAGFAADEPLTVPPALAEHVEAISVEPPATRYSPSGGV